MELDFSDKIKEYFSNNSEAARSGPKSGAQTPAKPSERKKGSSKNAKDSASSSEESSITFSDKVTKALQNKTKEHNEKYDKKVTLSQLKILMDKGGVTGGMLAKSRSIEKALLTGVNKVCVTHALEMQDLIETRIGGTLCVQMGRLEQVTKMKENNYAVS